MKAHYSALGGRITFELEAPTAKELFGEIAQVQEVFDAEHQCGMCGSDDIKFTVRESEGKKNGKSQTFQYYELRCRALLENGNACLARFDFGQSLDTENLFPKRKDADGNWMPARGWYRYTPKNGNGQTADTDRAPQSPTTPFSSGTPEGMQPSFDRLGEIFNKPAPTTLGRALDLVRDAMHHAAGKAGTDEFDQIYRKWQAEGVKDTKATKGLLGSLVKSYDEIVRPI